MNKLIKIIFFAALLASFQARAVIEIVQFDDAQQEQRYKDLIAELRCVVCQNQNLAESDAPLARDLRQITIEKIKQGQSDAQIKQFMRERYGDFVLYRPPFNANTAVLWLLPFFIFFAVALFVVRYIKQKEQHEALSSFSKHNEAQRTKVRNILNDTPDLD